MLAPLVATAWPITLVVICESEIELKGLKWPSICLLLFWLVMGFVDKR